MDKHGCTGELPGGPHLTPQERAEMPAIVARWVKAGRITVKREVVPAEPPADKAWAGRGHAGGAYFDRGVIEDVLNHRGPFTPKHLMTIAGIGRFNVGNVVAHWLEIGWVRRKPDGQYGEYERTEKFGQTEAKV